MKLRSGRKSGSHICVTSFSTMSYVVILRHCGEPEQHHFRARVDASDCSQKKYASVCSQSS
jgi:hypothetical protein